MTSAWKEKDGAKSDAKSVRWSPTVPEDVCGLIYGSTGEVNGNERWVTSMSLEGRNGAVGILLKLFE